MTPYYQDERLTVLNGDCREVMRLLEAESIAALVCDPPYGLEFMGKEWDKLGAGVESTAKSAGGFGKDSTANENAFAAARIRYGKSVANMQEWHRSWAVEALRVLKPGAHALVFGGTRTHHRLMCGLEDAGFEIRDCVMWVYGCLSEDTEVLVDGEWEPYHKATTGRRALCYSVKDDTYSWQPIEAQFVYDYNETAYQITSEDTDQIVSRNHRCVIDRGDGWEFVLAEEAAWQSQIHVPVLEDLHGLLESLSSVQPLSGGQEQNVLADLRGEGRLYGADREAEIVIGTEGPDNHLRGVSQEEVEARRVAPQSQEAYMLAEVQRSLTGQGMGERRTHGPGLVDARKRSGVGCADDRREQSSVEGRRNGFQEEGQLPRSPLRSLSPGISSDGPERWLRDGAPAIGGAGHRAVSTSTGNGSPRRPQPNQQSLTEPDAVRLQSGPQTIRASRYTRTDLARIEPVHYTGKVWCVKVPTGAFVVRRNGKVFITGNSGFPKSLDVSKAIDKAAGAERKTRRIPLTNEAKQWNGWGTALKPAWEPIIIARKPLEGAVAENVLKWGTGALNIDECRIPTNGEVIAPVFSGRKGMVNGQQYGNSGNYQSNVSALGRWPANLIHDGSNGVVELFPTVSGQIGGNNDPNGSMGYHGGAKGRSTPGIKDHGSAARFFYTAKASGSDRGNRIEPPAPLFGVTESEEFRNTHPTVKPIALMEYLVKLVLPPGGTLLDCFMGSGSTLVAARNLGASAIGIEQDVQSCLIAVRRLTSPFDPPAPVEQTRDERNGLFER